MKPLFEYLSKSKNWYDPFIALFYDYAEDIIRSGWDANDVNWDKPIEVSHVGSNISTMFTITYTNNAGVSKNAYNFQIPSSKHASSNEFVNQLVNDSKIVKKYNLPKLKFDRFGNIEESLNIAEAAGTNFERINFNMFDDKFRHKLEKNLYNDTYPALRCLADPMLCSNYYSDYSYMTVDLDDGTITLVARTIFTSYITFKVAKAKLKSRKPLVPEDLRKAVDQPASWGRLKEYTDEEKFAGCRVIICLIYNHYIGKDIDLPGIK